MRKMIVAALLAATGGIAALPVSAAQYTFDFAPSQLFFGTSSSGSGIFTTSDTAATIGGQTAYLVTSITGTIMLGNGTSSMIAAPMGSYGYYFTTGPTFLDGSGIRFNTVAGTQVSFFNQSNNGIYRVNTISPGGSEYVTATSGAAAVPEPASWSLMLLGVGALGFALRRRKGTALLSLTA